MKFDSLARWPLLLGAVILYVLAGTQLSDGAEGNGIDALIAVSCALLGSVLLGAWIWSLAVDTERKHYGTRHPVWDEPRQTSAPPAGGDGQDGAEGS